MIINKRLKIIIYLLLLAILAGAVVYFLGGKLEQQARLQMRDELSKLDAQVRELGVNICLIQPREHKSNRLLVMIDFWESDKHKILENLDKIKKEVSNYCRKEGIASPLITYMDPGGFDLEDTLRAEADVNLDETEAEYFSILNKFSTDLEGKLEEAFSREIEPWQYRLRIIADAQHDVTLNAYSARKVYFFARFKNADTSQLQAVRIAYKKISGFKLERGDKIYFYNQKTPDFLLTDRMKKLLDAEKARPNRVNTILFLDFPESGALPDNQPPAQGRQPALPAKTSLPLTPSPSPASGASPALTPELSPSGQPSLTAPALEDPAGSPSPVESPSPSPTGTLMPGVSGSADSITLPASPSPAGYTRRRF
jgi:hypothetical protein